MKIKSKFSLKKYTTFLIGGRADYFVQAENQEELADALAWAKEQGLPFFILGGGSNLLVSDDGFRGLVIRPVFNKVKAITDGLYAEAGLELSLLLEFCYKKKWRGLEWTAGMPRATLGGAIYMNAGALGHSMAEVVAEVSTLNSQTLGIRKFDFNDCQFSYKQSIFQQNKNLIIISALLRLEKDTSRAIYKRIDQALKKRQQNQPLKYPSAGSIFKNPLGNSAGDLIERAGLKGQKIGGAMVSTFHANFIVNFKNAESSDVIQLIELIKNHVKEKCGVLLEEEIELLGF